MDREGPPEKLTHNNEKEKMRALETFVWQHDVSSEEFSLALHIAEDTDAKITSLDKRLQNCIQEIKAAIEHGVQRETLEELLKKIERVEVSSYQGLVGEIAFLNVRNEEKEALINLVKTPISSNIKATFADGTTRIFSLPVVLLTTNRLKMKKEFVKELRDVIHVCLKEDSALKSIVIRKIATPSTEQESEANVPDENEEVQYSQQVDELDSFVHDHKMVYSQVAQAFDAALSGNNVHNLFSDKYQRDFQGRLKKVLQGGLPVDRVLDWMNALYRYERSVDSCFSIIDSLQTSDTEKGLLKSIVTMKQRGVITIKTESGSVQYGFLKNEKLTTEKDVAAELEVIVREYKGKKVSCTFVPYDDVRA